LGSADFEQILPIVLTVAVLAIILAHCFIFSIIEAFGAHDSTLSATEPADYSNIDQ